MFVYFYLDRLIAPDQMDIAQVYWAIIKCYYLSMSYEKINFFINKGCGRIGLNGKMVECALHSQGRVIDTLIFMLS